MISKNMSWNSNAAEPFLLAPAGKDYLWGGTRLKEGFYKELPMEPLAETWECSTHQDGQSRVVSGKFAGMSLGEVLERHPEFSGTHPEKKEELPILVKLLDAGKDLSIQVHPDDDYAKLHENGSLGKYEMWYVLDAVPGAKLIYGFLHDMEKEEVLRSIQDGTIEKYLQKISVKKNDVFFIPPGCVHAVGAGVVLAEVQESSNLTYRLYDYDRRDKNGEKRQLHIEKALQVAELKGSADPRQPLRVLRFQSGAASELLCRCKYFQVERVMVHTGTYHGAACFQTGSNSFQIFLCIEGSGVLFWENKQLSFRKGDCIFVPADSVSMEMQGNLQFLKIGC